MEAGSEAPAFEIAILDLKMQKRTVFKTDINIDYGQGSVTRLELLIFLFAQAQDK